MAMWKCQWCGSNFDCIMKLQSHRVDSCCAIESAEKIEVIKPSREDISQTSLQKTQDEEGSVELPVEEEEMTNAISVSLEQGEEDLISDDDSIPDLVEVNTQTRVDTGTSELISELTVEGEEMTNSISVSLEQGEEDLISDNDSIFFSYFAMINPRRF